MYKLYKFFKIPYEYDNSDNNLSLEDRYPLYAFTKEKLIKNQFKEQRDMKRFIMTKTEISEDEYTNFVNNHRHEMLEYFDYGHRVDTDDEGYPIMDYVQILSTRDEKEMVDSIVELSTDLDTDNIDYEFNVYALKKEFIKALRNLQFIYWWKFENKNRKFFEFLKEDERDDLDNDCPEMDYDEMGVFVYLYQDLLNL